MKIFISWSGNASRAVAITLRDWLPSVLQVVKPYVSSEDIEKGARWSAEIAQQLNDTAFGVICVTKDNVGSPWLNFEAGALSKSVDTSRVSPFLLDLRPADLVGPLSQLQATLPQREDVARLLLSLNSSTERPVDEARLRKSVNMWWPDLEEQLNVIRSEEDSAEAEPQRETRDMIEELLEISRGIQRRLLRGEAAEASKDVDDFYHTTREAISAVESMVLTKLKTALANSHETRRRRSLAPAGRVVGGRCHLFPARSWGESYLIELKYVSDSKDLPNKIIDGAGRLSIARRAYETSASGAIRCIILFIVADHYDSLMTRLKSQLVTIPDDIEALAFYESDLGDIVPSDLRQRLTAAASQSGSSS